MKIVTIYELNVPEIVAHLCPVVSKVQVWGGDHQISGNHQGIHWYSETPTFRLVISGQCLGHLCEFLHFVPQDQVEEGRGVVLRNGDGDGDVLPLRELTHLSQRFPRNRKLLPHESLPISHYGHRRHGHRFPLPISQYGHRRHGHRFLILRFYFQHHILKIISLHNSIKIC